MKIFLVTTVFPPCHGGMSTAAYYEAETLASEGHEVTVLTPDYRRFADSLPADEDRLSFKVIRLSTIPEMGNTAMCWNVLSHIRDADIVYLHYPFFGTAGMIWLAKLLRLPALKNAKLVLRYHMDVIGDGLRSAVFSAHAHLAMPAILKQADDIIFATLDYAKYSRAKWILEKSPKKCHEVPYGIRPDRFFRDDQFERNPNRVLFVGGLDRAHHFKGVSHLIDAAANLSISFPDLTLRIVGNGDLLKTYRAQAEDLGIKEKVEFVTSCGDDELRRHYCESAVTVLPSTGRSEAFGIVLIESMACGTPVIATALPGTRTLIKEGETGWLLPYTFDLDQNETLQHKHVNAIEQKISIVLKNPERAKAMGNNAYQLTCPAFYWKTVTRQISEIMCGTPS